MTAAGSDDACAKSTSNLRRIADEGAGYGLTLEGISAADATRRMATKAAAAE